jgi:hypothetical protein
MPKLTHLPKRTSSSSSSSSLPMAQRPNMPPNGCPPPPDMDLVTLPPLPAPCCAAFFLGRPGRAVWHTEHVSPPSFHNVQAGQLQKMGTLGASSMRGSGMPTPCFSGDGSSHCQAENGREGEGSATEEWGTGKERVRSMGRGKEEGIPR